MFDNIREDLKAVLEKDPAATGSIEVILTYPGFHAILLYRIAHWFIVMGMPLFARMISQTARFFTGVDIHPGAKIGKGLFIDHGMGVVIGETTEIGKNVVLFQGVTLGGTGKERGKRHPTLGSHVVVGAGAKVLGAIEIGDRVKVGANAVVLKSVPPNSTVVGVPGRIVRQYGERVADDAMMDHLQMPDPMNEMLLKMQKQITRLEQKLDPTAAGKKSDKSDKSEKHEKHDKHYDKAEKPERHDKHEKHEKRDKRDKQDKQPKNEPPVMPLHEETVQERQARMSRMERDERKKAFAMSGDKKPTSADKLDNDKADKQEKETNRQERQEKQEPAGGEQQEAAPRKRSRNRRRKKPGGGGGATGEAGGDRALLPDDGDNNQSGGGDQAASSENRAAAATDGGERHSHRSERREHVEQVSAPEPAPAAPGVEKPRSIFERDDPAE